MKTFRFLAETLLLGLVPYVSYQFCDYWALLIIPLSIVLGVYLDSEYFEPREKGELTFYSFRTRRRKNEELRKTMDTATEQLFSDFKNN
jgi:hypothetical protein